MIVTIKAVIQLRCRDCQLPQAAYAREPDIGCGPHGRGPVSHRFVFTGCLFSQVTPEIPTGRARTVPWVAVVRPDGLES